MPFDPFGIEAYHEKIRNRISDDEPGLAQSVVVDVLVSWDMSSPGPTMAYNPSAGLGESARPNAGAILEEMILDVASGQGIASRETFRRSRIVSMIEDREDYPPHWKKKHEEAVLLKSFYLRDGAPGARYLR